MEKEILRKSSYHKIFIGISAFFIALFVINVATFIVPSFDQFNLFYRFDTVHTLQDWNMPHNAEEYIDADRKKDFVMHYGCIFLSNMKASDIPTERVCTDLLVDKGKKKGYQIPLSPKAINSYLGKNNNKWYIVVYNTTETNFYEISSEGNVTEKTVPVLLNIDAFLYSLSHLYIYVI